MESSPENEIQVLQNENKTLRGKIRGYQRLGQLFQEVKEKNRYLEMECKKKDMVSVATETSLSPMDFPGDIVAMENTDPRIGNQHCNDITELQKSHETVLITNTPLKAVGASMESSIDQLNNTGQKDSLRQSFFSSKLQAFNLSTLTENTKNPEETNLLLRKKLEDALYLVEEFERKRSNDKKLVKILNEEAKKAKDEVRMVEDRCKDLKHEKDMMLMKIARLEHERDNLPTNSGPITTVAAEAEGAEDWVHLHQESLPGKADESENDYQVKQLQNKCKELEEKASRWENEHFNLQMESSKHITDLRSLLETKNKELINVSENLNSEKKILESKFKKLEALFKDEKDAKFEAYNMNQETMRKYKILEKKFLALEQKNINSPMGGLDPREMLASQMGPVSYNDEQVLMLKQQVSIFKEDFQNERKERLAAQKQAKTFEEKMFNMVREMEKKESEFTKCEKRLSEEIAKNVKHTQNISKLEADYKKVFDHNHMLMELQSKMTLNQPFKVKEPFPVPQACNPTDENPAKQLNKWSCKICTYLNNPQSEFCYVCKGPKSSLKGQNLPRIMQRWKCNCCTYVNDPKSDSCSVCKTPKLSSYLGEPLRPVNRRLSRPQEETVEANVYDNDLTIDGPDAADLPSEFMSNQ